MGRPRGQGGPRARGVVSNRLWRWPSPAPGEQGVAAKAQSDAGFARAGRAARPARDLIRLTVNDLVGLGWVAQSQSFMEKDALSDIAFSISLSMSYA
jgi:hypothetical protein